MPTIENLNVGLNLAAAGFTSGINGAIAGLSKFGLAVQGVQAAVSILETSMTRIVDQLQKIDEVGDLAGNLGISTEELSRLQYAAKQTDSSVEALNTALKRMASTRPGQSFIESVEEVQRSVNRAETARKIFGKGWIEISSLLRLSRKELRQLGVESDALHNTISGRMAQDANDATNAMQRLTDSWEGLKNMVANIAAPAITAAIDEMIISVRELVVGMNALQIAVSAIRGSAGGVVRGVFNLNDSIDKLNAVKGRIGRGGGRGGGGVGGGVDDGAFAAARAANVGASNYFSRQGFSAEKAGMAMVNLLAVAKQQLAEQKKAAEELKGIGKKLQPPPVAAGLN